MVFVTDVENCPEVGGAVYRSGFYKVSMARMWLTTTDKSPNVRVEKKKRQKCRCRETRCMWGKVKLVAMKYPIALQALSSIPV
jgi:hypothetical protein